MPLFAACGCEAGFAAVFAAAGLTGASWAVRCCSGLRRACCFLRGSACRVFCASCAASDFCTACPFPAWLGAPPLRPRRLRCPPPERSVSSPRAYLLLYTAIRSSKLNWVSFSVSADRFCDLRSPPRSIGSRRSAGSRRFRESGFRPPVRCPRSSAVFRGRESGTSAR